MKPTVQKRSMRRVRRRKRYFINDPLHRYTGNVIALTLLIAGSNERKERRTDEYASIRLFF